MLQLYKNPCIILKHLSVVHSKLQCYYKATAIFNIIHKQNLYALFLCGGLITMTYDQKLYICTDDGKKFFGKGPLVLLMYVDELKSLNKAATKMELSYHKALKLIKSAEEGFGFPLMSKKIGGENGGGSLLTPEAYEIIEKYKKFEKAMDEYASQVFSEIFKSEA